MNTDKPFKDTDIREALRRRYANTPKLPDGFMAGMEQRMANHGVDHRPNHRAWILSALAVAAAIALLVLLVKPHQAVPDRGALATTHLPRDPRPTYLDDAAPRTSTPSTRVPQESDSDGHAVRPRRTQSPKGTDSDSARYGLTAASDSSDSQPPSAILSNPNLHYAAQVKAGDTVAYQAPCRMEEFIEKMADFNQVKAVPLNCSSDKGVDSTIVSTAYVFEDKEESGLFARLLQAACWYDSKTPGYLLNFTRQQFFFTLKDLRKGEKYLWVAERLMDGRILLFSTHSPIETEISSACYQTYREQLTHTNPSTLQF